MNAMCALKSSGGQVSTWYGPPPGTFIISMYFMGLLLSGGAPLYDGAAFHTPSRSRGAAFDIAAAVECVGGRIDRPPAQLYRVCGVDRWTTRSRRPPESRAKPSFGVRRSSRSRLGSCRAT